MKEAIIYLGKALKIWQAKNKIEKTSHALRFLSRLWWLEGNRQKAEGYAQQAIDILETGPPSKIKAMAFSNMSQLKLFSEQLQECAEWGNKAIEMAREFNDNQTLCHALSNAGAALWRLSPANDEGKKLSMEGLELGLKNSFHEYAAQAYSMIIGN